MTKPTFRARALDANKQVAVYRGDEIPEQVDFSAAHRAIAEMPTGMEKEEEMEHHIWQLLNSNQQRAPNIQQRALNSQRVNGASEVLVIPVPDMDMVGERYSRLYGSRVPGGNGFRPPRQYIHVQPPSVEHEIPEYDMDSEDERWLSKEIKSLRMDVSAIKFENMLDRLEKGSGQMVVTLREAKALLKEDDDLTMAVYDYWLNKRLRLQHPLIPQVKSEKRDGSTTTNPYVAFRRRTERMQTRKNRKNDEQSYEKMLKMKKDIGRSLMLIEMVKRREKSKKELLQLTIEVCEQRYRSRDWDGRLVNQARLVARQSIPVYAPPPPPVHVVPHHLSTTYVPVQQQYISNSRGRDYVLQQQQDDSRSSSRRKREYRKRKHKPSSTTNAAERRVSHGGGGMSIPQPPPFYSGGATFPANVAYNMSAEEDVTASGVSSSEFDAENDPDGIYVFKRRANCSYQAPRSEVVDGWPWCSRTDHASTVTDVSDFRFRYSLTSIPVGGSPRGDTCIGYARRRVGRGGRVIFDRARTPWDEELSHLSFTSPTRHRSAASTSAAPIYTAPDVSGVPDMSSIYLNHLQTFSIPRYHPTIQSSCPVINISTDIDVVGSDDQGSLTTVLGGGGETSSRTNCTPRGEEETEEGPRNKRMRFTNTDDVPIRIPSTPTDNPALSTLPWDSILQLNYPLPSVSQSNPPLSVNQSNPPLSVNQSNPPLSVNQSNPPLSVNQSNPPPSLNQSNRPAASSSSSSSCLSFKPRTASAANLLLPIATTTTSATMPPIVMRISTGGQQQTAEGRFAPLTRVHQQPPAAALQSPAVTATLARNASVPVFGRNAVVASSSTPSRTISQVTADSARAGSGVIRNIGSASDGVSSGTRTILNNSVHSSSTAASCSGSVQSSVDSVKHCVRTTSTTVQNVSSPLLVTAQSNHSTWVRRDSPGNANNSLHNKTIAGGDASFVRNFVTFAKTTTLNQNSVGATRCNNVTLNNSGGVSGSSGVLSSTRPSPVVGGAAASGPPAAGAAASAHTMLRTGLPVVRSSTMTREPRDSRVSGASKEQIVAMEVT